jgi:hypothetical protein
MAPIMPEAERTVIVSAVLSCNGILKKELLLTLRGSIAPRVMHGFSTAVGVHRDGVGQAGERDQLRGQHHLGLGLTITTLGADCQKVALLITTKGAEIWQFLNQLMALLLPERLVGRNAIAIPSQGDGRL